MAQSLLKPGAMSMTKAFAALSAAVICFVISHGYARAAEASEPAPAPSEAAQTSPAPVDPPLYFVTPKMLRTPDFYVTVGRPDLAEQWTSRREARILVRGVGVVALAGGVVWLLRNLLVYDSLVCLDSACEREREQADLHMTGPFLTMVGGGVLMLVPNLWENDPVSAAQRLQLLNDAQKRGLRIAPPFQVTAAPTARGAGATFAISGSF